MGQRLRPVSSGRPKPMIGLFDRPVMEHIVDLLKKHGITDIHMTLQYMPRQIKDYFGDGSRFGVSIKYSEETKPLGTAGSVRLCAKDLGDEDFIVLSGDAVCDADLRSCIAFHRQRASDATIALYKHPSPLEYGLVMTAQDGRIERFIEKPSWKQVFTNTVNTGIYILSPKALSLIPPDRPFDFARDLFPRMLSDNMRLFGCVVEGYWCDVGDCKAYLTSAMDVLSGKTGIKIGAPALSKGLYSKKSYPGVRITPPVYIGEDVRIEENARIGPRAIIGRGSIIGSGAIIEDSIIECANIGRKAQIIGGIVCTGAVIQNGASLGEGCVIGAKTVVGEGAVLNENVRVWPGKEIEPGAHVRHNIVSGSFRRDVSFEENSVISGRFGADMTASLCLSLGAALTNSARTLGIASSGACAGLLARSLETGFTSGGGQSVILDAGFEAQAAFGARMYGLDMTVFLSYDSDYVSIRFFDSLGLPLDREAERAIEAAIIRGDEFCVPEGDMAEPRMLAGLPEAHLAVAMTFAGGKAGGVGVQGTDEAARTLERALGVFAVPTKGNRAAFRVSGDGFSFSAVDEKGGSIPEQRMLAMLCMLEFESGRETIALPYDAPATIDRIASRYGARVLRLERDRDARALYAKDLHLRDAVIGAAYISNILATRGCTLFELNARLPRFTTYSIELELSGDRGDVMRALCDEAGAGRELFEGLRVNGGGGWVHVFPCISRRALKIVGEGANMEAAAELCLDYEKRARRVDSSLSKLSNIGEKIGIQSRENVL